MDVEIEQPHRHHSTGHWLDKVLPLSAILISIVSIGIALHHGKVMESLVHQNERLVQANSLPHMELANSNATTDGKERISLTATNRGVGPAEIRSVQIKVEGRPVTDLPRLLDACCGGKGANLIGNSTILGRMLQAGQEVRYIDIPVTPASRKMARRLFDGYVSGRITTDICYCSVFGECWTQSSTGAVWPARVKSCPMPEPQYRY